MQTFPTVSLSTPTKARLPNMSSGSGDVEGREARWIQQYARQFSRPSEAAPNAAPWQSPGVNDVPHSGHRNAWGGYATPFFASDWSVATIARRSVAHRLPIRLGRLERAADDRQRLVMHLLNDTALGCAATPKEATGDVGGHRGCRAT